MFLRKSAKKQHKKIKSASEKSWMFVDCYENLKTGLLWSFESSYMFGALWLFKILQWRLECCMNGGRYHYYCSNVIFGDATSATPLGSPMHLHFPPFPWSHGMLDIACCRPSPIYRRQDRVVHPYYHLSSPSFVSCWHIPPPVFGNAHGRVQRTVFSYTEMLLLYEFWLTVRAKQIYVEFRSLCLLKESSTFETQDNN